MSDTKSQVLGDMKTFDKARIYDASGNLIGVGMCATGSKTQVYIKVSDGGGAGDYMRSTGKEKGGTRWAKLTTDEQYELARGELVTRLNAEADERERLAEAKRQADYDALPEAVKLARSLQWFCDCEKETTVAQAPIEAMRAIVEWAKANKKTTE